MQKRFQKTPKYRLHKPTGKGVVTIDGRDIYLGDHNSAESLLEYNRLIGEWVTSGRRLPKPGEDLSINELCVRFMEHASKYYRHKNGTPTSEVANFRPVVRALRELYGHTRASDFTPLALKTVRQAMIEAELCRNEINKRIGKVVRIFKWAVSEDLLPTSVYDALKTVTGLRANRSEARESPPVMPVDDARVDAIEHHTSRQVWAMVCLQRLSGARPGEIVQLRGADLDTSGPVWIFTPADHKTAYRGRPRHILFGPRAIAILTPWIRPDPNEYLFQPRESHAERLIALRAKRRTRVQPSQSDRAKRRPRKSAGSRYTSDSYRRAIEYACVRAGIPKWHPHQLRHLAATNLRRTFNLETAQTVLGHTSAATTQRYAERDLESAARAMLSIG